MADQLYVWAMVGVAMFVLLLLGAYFLRIYEQRNAERNADAIIYRTFNGKDVASYKIPRFGGSLPYDRIVAGAQIMGYRLVERSQSFTGTTLIFRRN